ncbi:ATP synthase subunit I [Thiohalorhabdus sp. Cl-TMA]|uniref:ATP synthase subunit I n=1 Tax=Thiohalorhabdus methylotrophus TaxID=3242694 RepID=A0ABV4TPI5_9GAMM
MVSHSELVNLTGRLIARQVVVVAVFVLLALYLDKQDLAKGLAYGGGLAALLAVMLSANLQRAADHKAGDANAIMLRGAVERFLVLGLAVVLAGLVWKISIGGVVGGLIIAHLVVYSEAFGATGGTSKYRTKSRIGE